MTRPFKLHAAPAVTKEIKYGKTVKNGSKTYPTKLEHLLVVNREKDSVNFIVDEDVHAIIGDKPKEVAIRLLSDDPIENFALFRGLFNNKGSLGCGGVVGGGMALRRFSEDSDWDGQPYEVDCSSECQYWKSGACDLSATLYFRLSPELPDSEAFGVMRVKGTHAQRRIQSSLDVLHKENWGILANLPLKVRYHIEKKRAADGKTYPIPMISIERDESNGSFLEALRDEIKRRAELYELLHGKPHSSIENLRISGALNSVNARDALIDPEQAEEFDAAEVVAPIEEVASIPEDVAALLDGMPKAKADNLMIKFSNTNGDIDVDALKHHLNKEMPF